MHEELIEKLRCCVDQIRCGDCRYVKDCDGDRMLMSQAADAIEELSKLKWIPVTKDSPGEGLSVLGAFKFQGGTGCIVTERITINGKEIWSAAVGMKPFAWMPLPEPPKGKHDGI